MIAAAVLLALVFIGVTEAIATSSTRPSRALEMVALDQRRAADPRRPRRPDRQRRARWAATSVQVRDLLPDRCSACGRCWRCRARSPPRRSAAAWSSWPRPACRAATIALEKLAGHLTGLAIVFLVTFVSIAIAGAPVRGSARRRDQRARRRSATPSGWCSWRSPPAASRSRSAPFIGRGAAAGIAGFVTIRRLRRSTATRRPSRQLAPFANLTWFGWTDEPPAARRPVRLAVASSSWRSSSSSCWPSASSPSRGATSASTSAVPTPSMPRALRRPARARSAGRSATTCARRSRGASASASSACSSRAPSTGFVDAARQLARLPAAAQRALPERRLRHGRRLPAAAVHRVRHRPGRPRRRDARRRLGVRRDVGPARDGPGDARCRASRWALQSGARPA